MLSHSSVHKPTRTASGCEPPLMTRTPREPHLSAAFVRFADTLRSDFDVVELLQELLEQSAQIVDSRDGGVLLVDPAGDLRLAASIGSRVAKMSPLELASSEGPLHSWPLQLRGETVGAMCFLGADSDELTASDLVLVQALADIVTIGILQERAIRERTDEIDRLQSALDSRVLIEQAKGILVGRTDVSMDDAFATLRTRARNENLTMRRVAEEVVARVD